jgi:hypothetical protein
LGTGQAKQGFGKDMETIGYGKTANASSIEKVSMQNGEMQGNRINYLDEGREKAGWNADKVAKGSAYSEVGKDMATTKMGEEIAKGFTDYMKGQENKAAMDTRQTIGSGKVELSEKDLKALESLGESGVRSQLGKGDAAEEILEESKREGIDKFRTSAKASELTNMAKAIESLKAHHGDTMDEKIEHMAEVAGKDASFKASQQIGAVEGTEKAVNAKKKDGESVNDALERLSNEMTSGKVASDFASVDTANSEYKGRDGLSGYATHAVDASVIKTQQSIGQTQGLNEIISSPDKLQSFLNKALDNITKTIGKEAAKEVKDDLIKSGVLGADGKVKEENWVRAKSYLSANNLNSHNALVAGGVVMSGALGKNASVQVNALNSSSSGNKTDTHEDDNTHHKGDKLDYDAIIDMFGNSTAGEVVKGIIGGAGFLGAIDMLSGGKVRKTFGAAKNKISNKVTGFSGRARGKGDDGKEKTFSPKNPTDVDEYLDNNPGGEPPHLKR